jgi:hypothetical protein
MRRGHGWMPPTALASPWIAARTRAAWCCLTFELTPTTEAGTVRLGRENVHRTSAQPYSACRSGSAVERGVRPQAAPSRGTHR